MKLAVVHYRWSLRGGAEKYLISLVTELQRRNHEIDIIVARQDYPIPAGVTAIHLPVARFPLWFRILAYAVTAKKVLGARCQHYDAILGMGKVWGSNIVRPGGGCHRAYEERMAVANMAISPGPASLYRVRKKLSLFNLMNRYVEDVMFRERPRVIAVSSLVRDDIDKYYGNLDLPITVIPNGRQPHPPDQNARESARKKIRKELSLKPESTVLLMMATNPLLKGFSHVLKAFQRFPDSFRTAHDPQFVVVGARRCSKMMKAAGIAGISSRFHCIPFVDKVDDWYQGADILVHPSLYDAFANVCLEAMSYGIPVLTSRLNGGADLYTDSIDGMVIERPWDHDGFSDRLMTAIETGSLVEMGERGRHLLSKYSFQANVDHVENCLHDVAVSLS